MSRTDHLHTVSPLKMTRTPRTFLSMSVTGRKPDNLPEGVGFYERTLKSYSIGEYRKTINHYSNRSECNEKNAYDGYHAREYIDALCKHHQSIWIVSAGLQRSFTLLGIWELFDNGRITLPGIRNRYGVPVQSTTGVKGYIAIGGKTEIIVCRWGDCTIRAISTSNYGNASITEILESVGEDIEARCIPGGEDSNEYPDNLTMQRAIGRWYGTMLFN